MLLLCRKCIIPVCIRIEVHHTKIKGGGQLLPWYKRAASLIVGNVATDWLIAAIRSPKRTKYQSWFDGTRLYGEDT